MQRKKSNAGQKTKYKDTFPTLAEGWAREGLSDAQIAEKLGIKKTAFYTYVAKYPEFAEGLARGKAPVDIEVENALLKKALGYDYEEEHTTVQIDKDGKPTRKERKVVKRHYPPDAVALKFWLVNRKPKQWREKQEHAISTEAGPIPVQFDFSKLSRDDIREIRQIVIDHRSRENTGRAGSDLSGSSKE